MPNIQGSIKVTKEDKKIFLSEGRSITAWMRRAFKAEVDRIKAEQGGK